MPVVDAYVRVVVDDSGLHSEIPVLLTDNGVVLPLLDFLLSKQINYGVSWRRKAVDAVKLLLQYMEANKLSFSDPSTLFQSFAVRIFTGFIFSVIFTWVRGDGA